MVALLDFTAFSFVALSAETLKFFLYLFNFSKVKRSLHLKGKPQVFLALEQWLGHFVKWNLK